MADVLVVLPPHRAVPSCNRKAGIQEEMQAHLLVSMFSCAADAYRHRLLLSFGAAQHP